MSKAKPRTFETDEEARAYLADYESLGQQGAADKYGLAKGTAIDRACRARAKLAGVSLLAMRKARKIGRPTRNVGTSGGGADSLGVSEKLPTIPDKPARAVLADRLGRISQLLEDSGIPLEEVGRVERIHLKSWQGLTKDEAGNAIVTDMHGEGLSLVPKWADGPAWPVIQQAPLVTIQQPARVPVPKREGWRRFVILPDVQVGYFHKGGKLIPIHDERALWCALALIEAADPDGVIVGGDVIDLSEASRFRKHRVFRETTQPSIDRVGLLAAEIRGRVRDECEIVITEGNHDVRLGLLLLDNAAAAYGLRRANTPESWPVMSLPFLCRFEDYGVRYLAGYPAAVYWLNDRLLARHGDKVRSKGSTAHMYLDDERHSTIYFHVHRIEEAWRTRLTHKGPRSFMAASPGCLCRIDGAVPGVEAGYGKDGTPVATANNWQQACAVVDVENGEGRFTYEAVRIWDGWMRWRDRDFVAPPDIVTVPLEAA